MFSSYIHCTICTTTAHIPILSDWDFIYLILDHLDYHRLNHINPVSSCSHIIPPTILIVCLFLDSYFIRALVSQPPLATPSFVSSSTPRELHTFFLAIRLPTSSLSHCEITFIYLFFLILHSQAYQPSHRCDTLICLLFGQL